MEECIFCFNTEDVFKLNGTCECRPTVDMACLEQWYKRQPDTCPICLKTYIEIIRVNTEQVDTRCGWVMCISKYTFAVSFATLIFSIIMYLNPSRSP